MKYIKVAHSDSNENYIRPIKEFQGIIDEEFDKIKDYEVGTSVTLTIIELTKEEYKNLNEFTGW